MDYVFDIVLMKGPPWGFRVTGGKDFNSQLRIAMVTHASEAQEQQIVPDDRILEINSVDCAALTHGEAQQEIKRAGQTLMLTLARKTELGIQPRVQYEVTPRIEWQPPQQRGTPAFADETAAKAMEKLSTDESDARGIGRRESPEGEEDQDIIQGRTFKMLQKATESPDGQSWPSRFSSGGAGDGQEKKGFSPALNIKHGERPQQEAGSSIRRAVVQVKPFATEQTTIMMSDETVSSESQPTGQTNSSHVEIPSKKVPSHSATSFSISTNPVASGATSFTVSSSNSPSAQKAASFDSSQRKGQQMKSQGRSLSASATNPSRISEETSPWLQKSDNGECKESPKPPASTEIQIINDDEVQPIRQGRTFRLLAQATTNDPPADAYKAVFEEGKLSRAQKK